MVVNQSDRQEEVNSPNPSVSVFKLFISPTKKKKKKRQLRER